MNRNLVSACSGILLVILSTFPTLAADCENNEPSMFDQSCVKFDLESKLYGLFQCRDDIPAGASMQNDRVACNWFVGEALATIWGRSEFFLSPVGRYMLTYEMAEIPADGWANLGWELLGTADDQSVLTTAEEAAFTGRAVVALRPGHVALILPGGLVNSDSWGLRVPRAAQFSLDQIDNAFVGCRLSHSWGAAKAPEVLIYAAIL